MFSDPLAKCLGPVQTEYVMQEMHERRRGNNVGVKSMVKTLIRAE